MSDDILAEVSAKGGDVARLSTLSKAELQQALKELGYSKLGDRLRVSAAIAAVPAASALAGRMLSMCCLRAGHVLADCVNACWPHASCPCADHVLPTC